MMININCYVFVLQKKNTRIAIKLFIMDPNRSEKLFYLILIKVIQ